MTVAHAKAAGIDLLKFIDFQLNPEPSEVTPCLGGSTRSINRQGQVGKAIGTIGFKHAGGYEVLVRWPDGVLDSWRPEGLRPAFPEKTRKRAEA